MPDKKEDSDKEESSIKWVIQEKKKSGNRLIEEFSDTVTRNMICWVKGSGTELCRSSQIWMLFSTISTVAMSGVRSNQKMQLKPKFSGTRHLDFLKENGK